MIKIAVGLLISLLSMSTSFAQVRFLEQSGDAMKLVNVLLKPEIQKCLDESGFRGIDVLAHARSTSISEKGHVTVYRIFIDHYRILPADGVALESVSELTIKATKRLVRAGSAADLLCAFGPASEIK